jgi:hypothetical protein
LVLQYLIPFSVISFSYYKVWVALARRSLPGRTRFREEIELCRKKRTNRMLIAMVVIFAICWLPLNIVHMVAEFHRSKLKHYKVLFLSTHVIAMSSTVYNPFLYSWLNDNFRKEFQELIPCVFKLCACFAHSRETRPHASYKSTPFADTELGQDRRSSVNHGSPDTIVNGIGNGFSKRLSLNLAQANGYMEEKTALNRGLEGFAINSHTA